MNTLLGARELKLDSSKEGAERARAQYESAYQFAEEEVDRYPRATEHRDVIIHWLRPGLRL